MPGMVELKRMHEGTKVLSGANILCCCHVNPHTAVHLTTFFSIFILFFWFKYVFWDYCGLATFFYLCVYFYLKLFFCPVQSRFFSFKLVFETSYGSNIFSPRNVEVCEVHLFPKVNSFQFFPLSNDRNIFYSKTFLWFGKIRKLP